jgi:diguanylate cyclase (GGDEF)-like protein/PAS domain S-box-containing protein
MNIQNNAVHHILAIELNGLRKNIFLRKNTYSIGRNSTNSIVIHHKLVSRNHATLLKVTYQTKQNNQDIFWIVDGDLQGNRSTNGIFVNGKRCLSSELKPGDIILFGGIEVKAKYNIANINSQFFLNNKKEQINQNNLEKFTKSQPILVSKKEINIEPLTEEFIARINSIKESLSYPIVDINLEGKITKLNSEAKEICSDLNSYHSINIEHPIINKLTSIFRDNKINLLIREIKIGSKIFTQYAHYLDHKKLIRSYLLDQQKRQQFNLTLRESEERYRSLIKQIDEGIVFVDILSKKILDANPAYCELLGYSWEEIIQLTIYDLISINRDILQKDLQRIIQERTPFIRESVHSCKDGSLVNVEVNVSLIVYDGKEAVCLIVKDITERKRTEEKLRYQASHDPLTNLPNQHFFREYLSISLANAKKTNQLLGLMFIKLQRFKIINYSLGHLFGDRLLQIFAKRIKSSLRFGDAIAHWGGDEFTILLPEINNSAQIANISQIILDQLKEPFIIGKKIIHVSISIGIAIYPDHGKDTTTLLKNADAALYYTQQKMGSKYQFYTPKMTFKAQEKFSLENQIYQALKQGQFQLLYQPEINVTTGEICSLEATINWSDLKLGDLVAEEFFSIAEESTLIIPLNKWIIRTACQQNMIWQEHKIPPVVVNVPLWQRYLQQNNCIADITKILTETGLDPNFLELNLQEKDFQNIGKNSCQNLQDLSEMKVRISLDNFGLGSSFSLIKKFTFNKIKIAEKFVQNIEIESENTTIISAIVTLGLGFNLKVISKGVSNLQQLQILHNLQCQEIQGTLFGNPLNSEAATHFLGGEAQNFTKIVNNKTIFDLSKLNNLARTD